jgi:hypothetical protein
VNVRIGDTQVKDEAQVIGLAHYLRDLDRRHALTALLGAATSSVAKEEGWILGVLGSEALGHEGGA